MTHDKPSKKVGAQVSEPREFWVSYEGMPFRKASEYYVETSETNDCIHVIEKSAYDELEAKLALAIEALVLAHEYHRKMLEDMYGADISVTQPHTFMENRLRVALSKIKGGAE